VRRKPCVPRRWSGHRPEGKACRRLGPSDVCYPLRTPQDRTCTKPMESAAQRAIPSIPGSSFQMEVGAR
jgi:hypothetical protein